jgi:membrane protein
MMMISWDQIKERFAAWYGYLAHDFWRDEHQQLSKLRILINHNMLLSFIVVRSFFRNKLFDTAGALVYTTLFSFVPFVAVLFALMKGFGLQETISQILTYGLHPLGNASVQLIVPQIMAFVNNTNIRTLGYIGFVLLLLSLLVIISTIEYSFNSIWRVKKQRKLYRRIIEYISFLFVGPIIALILLGWSANSKFQLWFHGISPSSFAGALLQLLGPWLLTIFIFWYFLKFIPNTKVHVRSALFAALVGATLWMIANWLFGSFIATAYVEGPQAAMYARFAVVPLLLLWLFIGWTILLFSSQIAYAHQNMDKLVWDRAHPYLSPMFYETLALKVLLRTFEQQARNGAASGEEELSDYFCLPEGVIDTVAVELVNLKLLVRHNGGKTRYTPAKPSDQILVADVMVQLRHFHPITRRHTAIDRLIREIINLSDCSMKQCWKDMTIQDMLDKLPPD